MFTANSGEKVWWICENNHEWEAVIGSRNNGGKCPICTNRKLQIGFNDLKTLFPELAKEWDYERNVDLSPKEITKSSGKTVWWQCKKTSIIKHSYLMSVDQRVRGYACPYCCNPPKKIMKGLNDLKSQNPEIMKEWDFDKNDIDPEEIFMGGEHKKAWFVCTRGHSYNAFISDKVRKSGCLENGKEYLIKEWSMDNLIRPSEVTYKSNIKVECE